MAPPYDSAMALTVFRSFDKGRNTVRPAYIAAGVMESGSNKGVRPCTLGEVSLETQRRNKRPNVGLTLASCADSGLLSSNSQFRYDR